MAEELLDINALPPAPTPPVSPAWSFAGYNIKTWLTNNKSFLKGCAAVLIAVGLTLLKGNISPAIALNGAAVTLLTALSKWLIDGVDFYTTVVQLENQS